MREPWSQTYQPSKWGLLELHKGAVTTPMCNQEQFVELCLRERSLFEISYNFPDFLETDTVYYPKHRCTSQNLISNTSMSS
jgi:hypothetical protein